MIQACIGTNADGGAPADMRFFTASSGSNCAERMRLDSSGYLGINTTSPSKRLEVRDTSAQLRLSYDGSYYCDFSVGSGGALTISPYGGSLIFTGTIGLTGNRVTQSYHTNITSTNAVTVDSDARWKTNIKKLTLGLGFIKELNPVSFNRKDDSQTHFGLIAQDVERCFDIPDDYGLYVKNSDGVLALRYEELIAPIINSVIELSNIVESLSERLRMLEG
jgi:hypothetical protein